MNRRLLTPGTYYHSADDVSFSVSSSGSFKVNGNAVVAPDPANTVISATSSISLTAPIINLNATTPKITGVFGGSPASPQMMTVNASGLLGSQAIPAGGGVTTMANIGAAPNAAGATISGATLTLQTANASFGGVLSAGTQSIKGSKTLVDQTTFTSGLTIASGQSIKQVTDNLIYNAADPTSIYMGANSHPGIGGTANNVGVGANTLLNATIGTRLIGVGFNAGSTYTNETDNIAIDNVGVAADAGQIRMGTNGTHVACFVQGISGATSAGAVPVVINAAGQLGTIVSSKKYKQNIKPIANNRILDLEAKQFRNIDSPEELQYGFIAEDVDEIMPEVIVYEEQKDVDGKIMLDDKQQPFMSTDPKTIKYHLLWPLLQDKVKEMSVELQGLKRWRQEVEDQNPSLFKIQRLG
jgi:hypothetical protein